MLSSGKIKFCLKTTTNLFSIYFFMALIIHWLVATLAIMVSAFLLPGVKVDGFLPALVTAVVLGFLNIFVKPILIFLTLPINILTLGLFTLVINALIIMAVSALVPGFHVNGFLWAMLFAVVLSVVNIVFGRM